jgi:hypothetical protein
MKKLSIIVIIASLVISPLASFAKTLISDSDLDNLTAETGVSITFNNVSVYGTVALEAASWGDNDGYTGNTGAGYVGFTDIDITGGPNLTTLNGSFLVDIGTSGSSTVINLGLPTLTIGSMDPSGVIRLAANKDLSGGGVLGTFFVWGLYSTAGGGTAQIFTQGGQGVDFSFNNVTLMGATNMTSYAFTDSNGFTGNTNTGSFGMYNVSITGNVARLVSTTAAVDVGTSGATTLVNIAMPTITMGAMNVISTMKLSSNAYGNLATGGILGVVDMRGFSTQASGSIQVFAH